MVPGPLIHVTEGERVRFVVKNDLPERHDVHWHGIKVPNAMDGVADVTQPPIAPGETLSMNSRPSRPAPTGITAMSTRISRSARACTERSSSTRRHRKLTRPTWTRCWCSTSGASPTARLTARCPWAAWIRTTLPSTARRSLPARQFDARVGDRVRLRFIAVGQFIHPMHLHGVPFKIVATDGHPVPEGAQLTKDTVSVAPASATTSSSQLPSPACGWFTVTSRTTRPTTAKSRAG